MKRIKRTTKKTTTSKKVVKKKPVKKPSLSGKYLSQVTTEVQDLPLTVVIHGPAGVGKTSTLAFIPDVLFICDNQEKGIYDLKEYNQVPSSVQTMPAVSSYTELLEMLYELATKKHHFKAIVIDGLTGLEQMCFDHCCQVDFDGDYSKNGFFSYQQGPKTAAKTHWVKLLDAFELVREAGIEVWLIGHTVIKPFQNPEGADFDKYTLQLDNAIWNKTLAWSQAVFFLNFDIITEKKGSIKSKAKGGTRRILHTEGRNTYDAKNRLGLPAEIDLGESPKEAWETLIAEIKESKKQRNY